MDDETDYIETEEEFEAWVKGVEDHCLKHFGLVPDFEDGTWITVGGPAW